MIFVVFCFSFNSTFSDTRIWQS